MTATPEHGARVLLELESADGYTARYRVVAITSESEHRTSVTLDTRAPRVEFQWLDGNNPPAWLGEFTKNLLQTLIKKHAPDANWPRRIHRWRDARG